MEARKDKAYWQALCALGSFLYLAVRPARKLWQILGALIVIFGGSVLATYRSAFGPRKQQITVGTKHEMITVGHFVWFVASVVLTTLVLFLIAGIRLQWRSHRLSVVQVRVEISPPVEANNMHYVRFRVHNDGPKGKFEMRVVDIRGIAGGPEPEWPVVWRGALAADSLPRGASELLDLCTFPKVPIDIIKGIESVRDVLAFKFPIVPKVSGPDPQAVWHNAPLANTSTYENILACTMQVRVVLRNEETDSILFDRWVTVSLVESNGEPVPQARFMADTEQTALLVSREG